MAKEKSKIEKNETTEKKENMKCDDKNCHVHGKLKTRGRIFEGTVIKKGFTRIVVLRSGKNGTNAWVNESVNIYNDYEKFFEKTPSNPQGIAILTDANSTRSIAVADYAEFKASDNIPKRVIAGEKN